MLIERKRRRRLTTRAIMVSFTLLIITSCFMAFLMVPSASISTDLFSNSARGIRLDVHKTDNFRNNLINETVWSYKAGNGSLAISQNSKKQTMNLKGGDEKKVNYDFEFLIKGEQICAGETAPFLLALILSVHTHLDTREVIRNTWGSVPKTQSWPGVGHLDLPVKVVFLFGSATPLKHELIRRESSIYGDIVQADFVDSYFNLTRKILMGIHWASKYCSRAKFILKADEDVFIHIPNLIQLLSGRIVNETGTMYGHTHVSAKVLRKGRWAVSNDTYPFAEYPTYACGNSYVISGHLANSIYEASGYMPYLNIEDVFVTGLVRKVIGTGIIDVVGFTHWFEKKPKPCTFHNPIKISATKVDAGLMKAIWNGLSKKMENCFKVPSKKPEIKHRPEFPQKLDRVSLRDTHIMYNTSNGKFFIL